mgnify:CR=1 FL=1
MELPNSERTDDDSADGAAYIVIELVKGMMIAKVNGAVVGAEDGADDNLFLSSFVRIDRIDMCSYQR